MMRISAGGDFELASKRTELRACLRAVVGDRVLIPRTAAGPSKCPVTSENAMLCPCSCPSRSRSQALLGTHFFPLGVLAERRRAKHSGKTVQAGLRLWPVARKREVRGASARQSRRVVAFPRQSLGTRTKLKSPPLGRQACIFQAARNRTPLT